MRTIDADALQRRICGAKCGCEYEHCGCEGDCQFDFFISNAPTVDAVEVVHGRWLTLEEFAEKIGADATGYSAGYSGGWVYCSECDQPMREINGWFYCPNCGAKMDGDGKAPTTNHRVCKHCNTAVIGMEEYAECPVCGHPFEEDAN